jgi:hypothetical protein
MVSSFPGLIAAAHVLPRLLAPRHPPCALDLLIVKNTTCFCHYGVFKVHAGSARPRKNRPVGRSLKTQQRTSTPNYRGRRCSRRARDLDGTAIDSSSAYRSNRSGIPRKEVIQPQLPLRLPCYDFTPIIDPTFDGSLPCGLGHRLRVLPTFVV